MNTEYLEAKVRELSDSIDGLQEPLESIAANLAKLVELTENSRIAPPARPDSGACARGKAEGAMVSDEDWAQARARWPKMADHPKTRSAYAAHLERQGKEPSIEALRKRVNEMEMGQYYQGSDFVAGGMSRDQANALIFFLKAGGFCVYREGKGLTRIAGV